MRPPAQDPGGRRQLRGQGGGQGLVDFDLQQLSNTAWAFAKVGHASPELFDVISATSARRRLSGFVEQDLANTLPRGNLLF